MDDDKSQRRETSILLCNNHPFMAQWCSDMSSKLGVDIDTHVLAGLHYIYVASTIM